MPIEINIPGSKSITNRALVLAALAKGTTIIKNAGLCDDTNYMIQGLKKLGVKIGVSGSTLKVRGGSFKKSNKPIRIYTGNAGTTTRFLTAVASLTGNKVVIEGDKRMKQRPITELLEALKNLGPNTKVAGNVSSQFLSALMMIAPLAKQNVTVTVEQKLCSRPYANMTIELLKAFGVNVKNKKIAQFFIPKQIIKSPKNFTVEGDASSASYIGAFSALHPKVKIHLNNLPKKSIQGDIKFLDYLKRMGEGNLKPLGIIDMNETPDLVMTFAVLAIFAKGKTKITNIGNLKVKESDRLEALKTEISKFGIKVNTTKDSIEIIGNPDFAKILPKKKIIIETYNDHRIAMAFGVIKDLVPQIIIKNPGCVSKSYPTFWKDLAKLQKHANRSQ